MLKELSEAIHTQHPSPQPREGTLCFVAGWTGLHYRNNIQPWKGHSLPHSNMGKTWGTMRSGTDWPQRRILCDSYPSSPECWWADQGGGVTKGCLLGTVSQVKRLWRLYSEQVEVYYSWCVWWQVLYLTTVLNNVHRHTPFLGVNRYALKKNP